jgi:hypothetical protein
MLWTLCGQDPNFRRKQSATDEVLNFTVIGLWIYSGALCAGFIAHEHYPGWGSIRPRRKSEADRCFEALSSSPAASWKN